MFKDGLLSFKNMIVAVEMVQPQSFTGLMGSASSVLSRHEIL